MMTTRAMSTSCGNRRDIAGNCASGGISTGCNDHIGADTQTTATGSVVAAATTIKTRTTITSDPGILCFHHCNVKVFCFTLPHICPQCKTPLDTQQHPNGMGNKRQLKNKKRTTNDNESIANTKERNHYRNNNNSNNNNNKNTDADNIDKSHGIDLDKDGNDDDHDDDNDDDNEDDDDDDDGDGDGDTNESSLVSQIMSSRLLPFRLPYPFVRANQYPCAIVLRPTTGDFLNDYNNTTDLHIAVTTSTGCVVEFDRHGLRRHRTDNMSDWWQSLLVGDVPEPWYDYWDQVLFEICQQPDKWTVSHYHEDKHNCYTFVLTFLQALTYDKLSEAATSKTTFCEKYIVPRTTTAGKYISLYRKLRDTGIYVHHTNHHHHHHHNKQRHASSSYGKVGNKRLQQQQQLQQNNKLNTATAEMMAISAKTTLQQRQHLNQQQQQKQQQQQQQQQQEHQQQQHMLLKQSQQKQHHHSNHHNSIKSRPHSTLCTIEE